MSTTITVEQANKMLPLVRSIVSDIMGMWEQILTKRTELACIEKEKVSINRLTELKEELNYIIDKINGYIKEIEQLGCYVEEFKRGIINFPSLRSGRKVFLCWLPTDKTVTHYHELDETCNYRVKI